MNKHLKTAIGTFAACVLGVSGVAHAGGTDITSVQNGDWSSASTWDIRVPDASLADQAHVIHVVDITTSGANANVLNVGSSGGAGTLNIIAGDLSVSSWFSVGFLGGSGTVNMSGGTVSGGETRIGSSAAGAMTISSGTLNTPVRVGADGHLGSFTVAGGGASITLGTAPTIGVNGTLVIQPTANGSAGLSTITATGGAVTLDAGSTLELDTSFYIPAVGDSWDVITYAGSVSGTFGTLDAPLGFAIEEDQTVSGVVTIRVTRASSPYLIDNPGPPLEGTGGANISRWVTAADFVVQDAPVELTELTVWILENSTGAGDDGIFNGFSGTLSWAIYTNGGSDLPDTQLATFVDSSLSPIDIGVLSTTAQSKLKKLSGRVR